jgi:hypothetical protein
MTAVKAAPPLTDLASAGSDLAQALHRPQPWYRDAASCLPATIATVLAHAGHDPLELIGTGWSFAHIPGELPFEEFYWPVPAGTDLGRCLIPHHPVEVRWTACAAPDTALTEFAALLRRGLLPIIAVDNFHLPFRPAYHDVHAAHLIVLYGVDRYRDLVLVADPAPPGFNGPLAVAAFTAASSSTNPADDQDAFFAETEIGQRYLVVEPSAELASLDPAGFGAALQRNLDGFLADDAEHPAGSWVGLAGLRRYLGSLSRAVAAADCQQLRQAYPFGWGPQGSAAIHGELLRARGGQWRLPELIEAGRAVEQVAHQWTALRVTAAHYWNEPDRIGGLLDLRSHQLLSGHQRALDLLPVAIDRLR